MDEPTTSSVTEPIVATDPITVATDPIEDLRVRKLQTYLFNVINTMTADRSYQIGIDQLGKIGDFSLDKMPVDNEVEKWIIGVGIKRDVYSFRSKKAYSRDTINNLKNIGWFEEFERKIDSNNDKGVLPDIQGIENIKCLNCGTFSSEDGTQATFDIQIEIAYRE